MVAFSKFTTVTATCEEYLHPYTNSCALSSLQLCYSAIPGTLKMYTVVFLLAMLMRGKLPTPKDILGMILRIIQSTSFLTCHAFSYSLFMCSLRRIFGNFNMMTASFIPAFLASYVSILIERPSRRGLLSLYVTNVASETLFRMAAWRGYVRPIQHGEVVIFMLSIAGLLYFYRCKQSSQDVIYGLLRFIVGPYEESAYTKNQGPDERENEKPRKVPYGVIAAAVRLYSACVKRVRSWSKHKECPHPFSCVHYVLQGTTKLFSVGYGLQVCLRLLLQMKHLVHDPRRIKRIVFHKDAFFFGAFLGGFSGVFRTSSCALRWLLNKDSKFHAVPAGLLAGLTFALFPDITIALYLMWKWLQLMYNDGVGKGFLPELPGATVLLYCTSTAILFHAALLEPHNLRPSYWKFLHRVSGGWIVSMDRRPLDAFGLGSSKSLQQVLLSTGTSPFPLTRL
ncbi:transmembrane protein 135 isoform X1 [Anabrus simplex]|uniref:transmembrane protein 135 isoform X1 n=1 Tax=Anabrus simplex TaxID=316456 RepID=UPI0034DD4118